MSVPHLLNHSSLDGHLGCFHVLAFVSSAAVNIVVRVSFSVVVFSGCIHSAIADSCGSSVFSFFMNNGCFFKIIFNWRVIGSQCCGGSCSTAV